MFLLIRSMSLIIVGDCSSFTFHNVSINTVVDGDMKIKLNSFTFHNVSINTIILRRPRFRPRVFTFHNVSINTDFQVFTFLCRTSLHSIMFLLIRNNASGMPVSILCFTFHNVSINTIYRISALRTFDLLYIP